MRKLFVWLTAIVCLSLIVGCANSGVEDSTAKVRRASAFIKAIGEQDNDQALSYLTQDTRDIVLKSCPDSSVIECFNELGWKDWGEIEDIAFDYGKQDVSAFTVKLSKQAIRIVIISSLEDNKWLVSGWRGVVPVSYGGSSNQDSEGWPIGLIDGSNPINAFPPEK